MMRLLISACAVALLAGCSGSQGGDSDAPAISVGEDTVIEVTAAEPGTEIHRSADPLGTTRFVAVGSGPGDTEVRQKVNLLLSGFETSTTETGDTVLIVPEVVLFDTGAADLKPEAKETLDKVAELLGYTQTERIIVTGHTDSQGPDDANLRLSTARAESVVAHLTDMGVESTRLVADGKGETAPRVPNENADGTENPDNMAKNRRVEIVVAGLPSDDTASDSHTGSAAATATTE